jgi:outer membrane receptor protein involved in Fe transport
LAFGPWQDTEAYLNLGYGHHSNDARGATIRFDPQSGLAAQRADLLVRARGADVGVRTTALAGLNATASVFVLELDSELVFVGDAGSTEAGRPSRRVGVEVANFWRPRDGLTIDFDATWADARFTDDDPAGDHIPGAIETTVATGVAVDLPKGFLAGLRWRYCGPRPLLENGSVRSGSTSLVNLQVGKALPEGVELVAEVFNLLDREDSDIEYFYASRLPGEPTDGVEEIHFHPMEERSVRFAVRWRPGR